MPLFHFMHTSNETFLTKVKMPDRKILSSFGLNAQEVVQILCCVMKGAMSWRISAENFLNVQPMIFFPMIYCVRPLNKYKPYAGHKPSQVTTN